MVLFVLIIFRMKKFILLFLLITKVAFVSAASLDSVRISLLTCAPGTEIYALFGHTAIRYEDPKRGQDWVYNYGMFNFREPNFVMRFVRGETDYQLGRIPFSYFEAEYAMRGSAVYQQVLNLTNEEKIRLITSLEENYRPVNRVYRYNYFYDNCTTRARDKIEESIYGTVVYPEGANNVSFRDIVHEYTAGHEWSEFGIDLCLGMDADKHIDIRRQMFAPFYMKRFASEAMIHRADTVVPFVAEEFKVVDAERTEEDVCWCSPMMGAMLLLLFTLLMVWRSVRKGRFPWAWDALLFGAQGFGGIIVSFLFFFSVHPTVGSNWLVVLFNPLPLIYLPWMIYKDVKGKKDRYHGINSVCLTFFIILMPLLLQEFNLTVLPLALSLLLTSVGHLYIYSRKHS